MDHYGKVSLEIEKNHDLKLQFYFMYLLLLSSSSRKSSFESWVSSYTISHGAELILLRNFA